MDLTMLLEKVAPYWLICLAIIAILLLMLRGLVILSGARRRTHGIAALHQDQRGSVQSLSFVLTLPVFIMIIMSIVQISQIMLAKVVVEYAALASARAASVWTSQYIGESSNPDTSSQISMNVSERNCIGTERIPKFPSNDSGNENQQVANVFYYYKSNSGKVDVYQTPKVKQIAMAAHLACLPICPSHWPYRTPPVLEGDDLKTLESLERTYDALTGKLAQDERDSHKAIIKKYWPDDDDADTPVVTYGNPHIKNKLAYSMGSKLSPPNTRIDIEIEHPSSEPSFYGPCQTYRSDTDSSDSRRYCEAYQVNPTYEFFAGEQVQPLADIDPCEESDECPENLFAIVGGQALFNSSADGCECNNTVKYHPDYYNEAQLFRPNQVGWQDRITITVYHDLALLPGPAKLLARMMHAQNETKGINDKQDNTRDFIGKHEGRLSEADGIFYTWPLIAKASAINEGDLSILRYEHEKRMDENLESN